MTVSKQGLISAPSNIALIKYMGKLDHSKNRPTNSSLSWTLNNLRSYVRISEASTDSDQWGPLQAEGLFQPELSSKGKERYLSHFQRIKKLFGDEGSYLVESANDFPSDCGLASSASSFAALTMAAVDFFKKKKPMKEEMNLMDLAQLSALGSGSSCRSFFGPWSLWYSEGVRPLEFSMKTLFHQVIVIDKSIKQVSSSEAHRRVANSKTFVGRPERAERRLANLIAALQANDWKEIFQITWDEFIDMHELFENSSPSFTYIQDGSKAVLADLQELWRDQGDGPVVTMDAGPNIHLLYRADQIPLATTLKNKYQGRYEVL